MVIVSPLSAPCPVRVSVTVLVPKATNEILVRGQFTSLREAQINADVLKTSEVDAYVQGQQNRVLYQA